MKFSKAQQQMVGQPLIRLAGLVWVPEDTLAKREEREEIPYRALSEIPYLGGKPCVRLCRGEVIDYGQVGRDIIEFSSLFKVQCIGYDPAYSIFVVDPYLEPAGLKCIPFRQGYLSMGPATKRFIELVRKRQLAHGSHPMLDNAVAGCVLSRPDKAGNKHPAKDKSISRIDALVSAIMATSWACDPPVELPGLGAWSGQPGSGIFD